MSSARRWRHHHKKLQVRASQACWAVLQQSLYILGLQGGNLVRFCVFTAVLLRMQRYISTRPMFIDVRELSAGAAAGSVTDAAAAGIALRDLSQQYKGLLTAVKEEALVMEQVFPSPRNALAIFVQRVFEQRVQVGHAHGPSSCLRISLRSCLSCDDSHDRHPLLPGLAPYAPLKKRLQ